MTMDDSDKFVILLKGETESEDDRKLTYEDAIYPNIATRISVLEFENAAFDADKIIEDSRVCDHVIVTSSRAVRAIQDAQNDCLTEHLIPLKWIVVGAATAEAVRKHINPNTAIGEDCGNAASLVDMIGRLNPAPACVLYLCGDHRRSTLEDGLKVLGIPARVHVVYRTVIKQNVNLPEAPPNKIRVCVFFSPSGVSAVKTEVKQSDKIISIGTTTAWALEAEGIRVDAIASTPTPRGVADAITTL